MQTKRAEEELTKMVGTYFERLIASHHKSNLLRFLMLKETNIAGPPLLPLVCFGRKSEKFGTPAKPN
jgi:hypothetical protein